MESKRRGGNPRLRGVLNAFDARERAAKRIPKAIFDYVDGGAEDELTLRWNREAFSEVSFAPRAGVWVPNPDLKTSLFGDEISMPVLTAPCGGMRLVHPHGDLGLAQAAAAAGTIHVATSASGYSMEEIAAATTGVKWFQAYRFSNEPALHSLVLRAKAAGYKALVATVDTQVGANREKDFRNGFSYDMRINLKNIATMAPRVIGRPGWVARFTLDGMPFVLPNTADITPNGKPMELGKMTATSRDSHSPVWEDISWMRKNWDGPLLVKGILTPEDAKKAISLGVDGIIVSNHGGRQLDGAPASLRQLPRIVDAVGDRATVLMDGGIRRGSDVAKALSLGAAAVLAGRVPAYGLAIAGSAGVEHVLELLRSELVRLLHLLGCESVSDLDQSWLTDGIVDAPRPPLPVRM